MAEPLRVVFVQTHPVQYLAPWFQWMARHERGLDVTVLYAVEPTPRAQAAGFGGAFTWEQPLRDGYSSRVLRAAPYDGDLDAARFSVVDAPDLERALGAIDPHAVVVPGWHAAFYTRALEVCSRHGWPAIYRGDSTLASGRPNVPRLVRRAATRRRLRRFGACLAVGRRSRDYLLAHGVVDPLIFASPHAVDDAFFARAIRARATAEGRARLRDRFGLEAGRRVVLFAGKLQPKKRPLDLVRALAALPDRVQLLVAGAGPLEAECAAEAARLGVPATFAGFLQPGDLADAYAAADVLALPSDGDETWGLVVNEALSAGVPCVVSDAVGSVPDLVDESTGAVFPCGDTEALGAQLRAVLARVAGGHSYDPACRARIRGYSFDAATRGLRAAVRRVVARRAREDHPRSPNRLVACCGSMATAGGLERMTFEVLGVARRQGADVHCIVNTWGSSGIVDLADGIGASWSTGFYWYRLQRQVWRPQVAARIAWDVLRTSLGLLRDGWDATTILVPDETAVLRNLPALLVLRLKGARIVHRLGTAPQTSPGYRYLWRRVLAPVSHALVCNSPFTARELEACGVRGAKVVVIPNVLPANRHPPAPPAPVPGRVLYAGQIIPAKGVHLLLDAVARLASRGHDITLDIAGDIDGWESPTWAGYHARLRARAASAPLAGRVRFLGWQDDVPSRMGEAWIHAAPSLPECREGFGLVVLEAKAAGVPSVVGQSGALPDLVEHGADGWVAGPTADDLADGLEVFLDPRTRAEAAAAARRSLARFAPERFTASWAGVFQWRRAVPGAAEAEPCR